MASLRAFLPMACLAIILTPLPCPHADAQSLFSHPSKAALAKANEVLGRVNSERKANAGKPDAWPWTGQYYAGDGMGFNFRMAIAPKAGAVYWSEGCMGLYKVEYGSFEEKDGSIRLAFEKLEPEEAGKDKGLHPVLIPLRWKNCRYLIPENEMIDFCNHVNSGSPYVSRAARFFQHVDDKEGDSSEMPKVPPKYRPYLLKTPIDAEIAWIGKTSVVERENCWPPGKYRVTEVRLNRGKADGLLQEMRLYCDSPSEIRIVDVSDSSARAEAADCLLEEEEDTPEAKEPQVQPGLRCSTQSPRSEADRVRLDAPSMAAGTDQRE